MANDDEAKLKFQEACRKYAAARNDVNVGSKEKNALYNACIEAGKAAGMSQYEMAEIIDDCVENSYFEK